MLRSLDDGEVLRNLRLGDGAALVGTEYETVARRAMADQRPERVTFHYPPRDRWFEVQFYPLTDGITILANDVTAQMRTKSSLAERGTELGALYEFTDRLQQVTDDARRFMLTFDAGCHYLIISGSHAEELELRHHVKKLCTFHQKFLRKVS